MAPLAVLSTRRGSFYIMINLNHQTKLRTTLENYGKWGYESGPVDGNNRKWASFTPTYPATVPDPFGIDPEGQYQLWGLVRNGVEKCVIADLEGMVNPENPNQPHALHMSGCRGVRLVCPTFIGTVPTHGHYGISLNDCHEIDIIGGNFRDVHVGVQLAGCSDVLIEDTAAVVSDPDELEQFRGTVSLHEGYNRDITLRRVSGRVVLGNLTWRTKIKRVILEDCDLELLTLYGDIESVEIIGGRVQRNIQIVAVNEDHPRDIVFSGGAELWDGVQLATYESDRTGFRQVDDSEWWKGAGIRFDDVKARKGQKPYVFASSPGLRTWQVAFDGSLDVSAFEWQADF